MQAGRLWDDFVVSTIVYGSSPQDLKHMWRLDMSELSLKGVPECSFEEYVDSFIATVKPDVLSYDCCALHPLGPLPPAC